MFKTIPSKSKITWIVVRVCNLIDKVIQVFFVIPLHPAPHITKNNHIIGT